MNILRRVVPLLVIVALVVAAGFSILTGTEQKQLTALFPRTISIYEGSDVRVLGVPVGKVDTVTPSGTDVEVTMTYDATVQLPADASAVIVAPSIVGDRFVQLTPVYEGGPTLPDGATLQVDQTSTPVELDDIYSSLDRLTVALGPNGANREGALTDLLESTAANFGGQGAAFNQTISNFSQLSATLDDNKEELFGSAAELEKFVGTLARNDQTVRDFNSSLGSVSSLLAGERQELAQALANLQVGLGKVATFVQENRDVLGRNITGLNRVSKVLVKQRAALEETLKDAPLALSNVLLAYNPQTGTLDTNSNIGELVNQVTSDPATLLCGLVSAADPQAQLCGLIQGLLPKDALSGLLPRAGTFGSMGAGTGTSYGVRSDPTLGGLVAGGTR